MGVHSKLKSGRRRMCAGTMWYEEWVLELFRRVPWYCLGPKEMNRCRPERNEWENEENKIQT